MIPPSRDKKRPSREGKGENGGYAAPAYGGILLRRGLRGNWQVTAEPSFTSSFGQCDSENIVVSTSATFTKNAGQPLVLRIGCVGSTLSARMSESANRNGSTAHVIAR